MTNGGKVRIKGEDNARLKQLKRHPEVRELAVERGVIENVDDPLYFDDMMDLIIPEDADTISRPEDEMVWQDAGEVKPRIQDIAGENVSIHEVISEFTNEFIDNHEINV